jgi:hypothetical protein
MAALDEMELSVADLEMSLRQLARKDMQASSKAIVNSDTFMVGCLGLEPVIIKILLYIQKQFCVYIAGRMDRFTGAEGNRLCK